MKTAVLPRVALFSVAASMASAKELPPEPVAHVNLERYAGRWYEVARLPNRFQSQCARGVTAEYTLREDGRIEVVNRCVRADGSVDESEAIARVDRTPSNAKLKVGFLRVFGISLFSADYWILDLGSDYEYAVVGTPSRKYGWILSRTPTMEAAALEQVFTRLRQQGYDPDEFEMTPP